MMRMLLRLAMWSAIVLLATFHLFGAFQSLPGGDGFPQRPIQVVVPYKAGGGTDLFARLIQRAVAEQDSLGQPLVIVNQDGGSGTIGSRLVKQAKPDGYKILCLHDGIMTSKLSRTVNYGPEAFEAIAQTGDMLLMVVVRQESPIQSLTELMEQARRSPQEITFGTNIGAPAHFAGRLLEDAVRGARFNFVQSGGGANRYTLLVGGHIDVGVFSLNEFMQYRQDGSLRALAVLSPQRHPWIPEIPTAREQKIDVVSGNGFFWWAPKGTPPDRVERIAAALADAMTSTRISNHALDPVFRSGNKLLEYLEQRYRALSRVRPTEITPLPDFANGMLAVTMGLLCLVIWKRSRAVQTAPAVAFSPSSRSRAICFLVLCGYVAVLQWGVVDYVIATSFMVFLVGSIICRWRTTSLLPLLEVSLLTALGTQAVFTRVFSVVLP